MKRVILVFAIIIPALIFLSACQKEDKKNENNGRVVLSLTDSPIDNEDIKGVFVTFTRIDFRKDGQWHSFDEFDEPQTINLLELTNGNTVLLGDFNSGAGTYSELRFILDAPDMNATPTGNPGCYLLFEDETTQPLFIPSGAQSGFKAKGSFNVPVNATVHVTADFDVRKSIVKAGASGKYILKPVIRVVVNDQAGSIEGTITYGLNQDALVLYAYEHGDYDESEAAEPGEGETRFANSVSSSAVSNGTFVLPFLAEGSYDIVLGVYLGGEFVTALMVAEDVVVEAGKKTNLTINLEL